MDEDRGSEDKDKRDVTVRMPVMSVSYGAFSLTLEGFDDPFATMRDVADYFRTVLSEDRSFGTWPSGGRTATLHGFAERSTGRRVEARAAGGQVHLRVASESLRPITGPETLFDEEAATEEPENTGTADPLAEALETPRADAFPTETVAPVATERRPGLPAEADEAALERLISQTDSALAGAEAQRRHATFAQLKAAVAATRAEVDAGGRRSPSHSAAEIARYRDVLAQNGGGEPATRRARPEEARQSPSAATPAARSPDPTTEPADGPRPEGKGVEKTRSPLIQLVARRAANGAGGGSSSPRTDLAQTAEALFDEGGERSELPHSGFERFLATAAPAGLGDLIDAAAAFLAHVEKLEDFPRPQVMRLIAPRLGSEPREEVMRAFGVLLREGRLRRSRRGQFQSGENSFYARAARRFRTEA